MTLSKIKHYQFEYIFDSYYGRQMVFVNINNKYYLYEIPPQYYDKQDFIEKHSSKEDCLLSINNQIYKKRKYISNRLRKTINNLIREVLPELFL